ncbi:dihydrodipicolinate synthase family protein [Aspergillus mulundensis]|uniref:4-hydroxy-2-oxoglutarate aldolase, mitochondrial n=1 Tax=Aspergillus mulundensis TaxID=1810919 RepID=A0A3D8SUF8_9EURO|nr:hypothetical protein DSM5745_01586 [Aspergillus mulundensis]RDW89811.1 hypothetical protein DSM5745_01586 [Aspergillus mulundensis]
MTVRNGTSSSTTNGTSASPSHTSLPTVPPSGVWAPAITFINAPTDTLDLRTQSKYYAYLSSTGLSGLVILGTNAEPFLLTREERKTLLLTARQSVPDTFPLMAGVSGHSTKQVLEFIADAKDAGADYALCLPPGYFGKQTTSEVVVDFFDEIAAASPLPIVIYNFPAVVNGVDLDSATIAALARKWPGKIVGVKLTCGSVAKITRLSAELPEGTFAAFGGQSDFLVGGLAAGAVGTIAGFANVFPKTIVRIYDLYQAGMVKEAVELHKKAALAEQPCKAGIASVKYAVGITTAKKAGIEGAAEKLKPRRPYKALDEKGKIAVEEMELRISTEQHQHTHPVNLSSNAAYSPDRDGSRPYPTSCAELLAQCSCIHCPVYSQTWPYPAAVNNTPPQRELGAYHMVSQDGEARFPINGSRVLRDNNRAHHRDRLVKADDLDPASFILPLLQEIVKRPAHLMEGLGPGS